MINRPLTAKERIFAEDNHGLIHAFLNKKKLPESLFYDVVVFDYLDAVQQYLSNEKLRRYRFATVAWLRMNRALSNYYKYLMRQKRCIPTVSIDAPIGSEDGMRWEELLGCRDYLMECLELELLLQALATKVSRRDMRIIRMRVQGERMHDIAHETHLRFRDINDQLKRHQKTVVKLLHDE